HTWPPTSAQQETTSAHRRPPAPASARPQTTRVWLTDARKPQPRVGAIGYAVKHTRPGKTDFNQLAHAGTDGKLVSGIDQAHLQGGCCSWLVVVGQHHQQGADLHAEQKCVRRYTAGHLARLVARFLDHKKISARIRGIAHERRAMGGIKWHP